MIQNALNDDRLRENFGYAMSMIGIKLTADKKEEVELALSFVKRTFRYLCVDEIRTAFDLLVEGLILPEKDHYGSFSPIYVGYVLKSYLELRPKYLIEITRFENRNLKQIPYVPDSLKQKQIQMEFDREVVRKCFEKYKQFNIIDSGTCPIKFIYNSVVVHHQYITFTPKQKREIADEAAIVIEEMRKQNEEGKPKTYNDYKLKQKVIKELNDPEASGNELRDICYKIAVKMAFDEMIKKGETI